MSEEPKQKELNVWNPMENDFLAQRNIYKIDDEDVGLALHGYSKYVQCVEYILWSYALKFVV